MKEEIVKVIQNVKEINTKAALVMIVDMLASNIDINEKLQKNEGKMDEILKLLRTGKSS